MFGRYNINWSLFIKRNVDPERRFPKRLAWLNSLIKPVVVIYDLFMEFRNQALNRAQYNAQVIYLEKGLNDTFNPDYPATFFLPIYIYHFNTYIDGPIFYRDSDPVDSIVVYRDSDAANGLIMYRDSDYSGQVDFIVYVPTSLIDFGANPDMITRIKAFVDQYNQADKKFTIENY